MILAILYMRNWFEGKVSAIICEILAGGVLYVGLSGIYLTLRYRINLYQLIYKLIKKRGR